MSRTRRHLNVLAHSAPLHRQARELQSDVNASYLLVHDTLSKAFAQTPGVQPTDKDLAEALRADLLQTFRASDDRA